MKTHFSRFSLILFCRQSKAGIRYSHHLGSITDQMLRCPGAEIKVLKQDRSCTDHDCDAEGQYKLIQLEPVV